MARYLSWVSTNQHFLADDVRERCVSVCSVAGVVNVLWNTVTGNLIMLREGYVYEAYWFNDATEGYETYKRGD